MPVIVENVCFGSNADMTSASRAMSALTPKAAIPQAERHVFYVPEADIEWYVPRIATTGQVNEPITS